MVTGMHSPSPDTATELTRSSWPSNTLNNCKAPTANHQNAAVVANPPGRGSAPHVDGLIRAGRHQFGTVDAERQTAEMLSEYAG